jgi:hypothetical protein
MRAADVMAIVLFLFFLVGVAVGFLVVVAVSARRAHKAGPPVAPLPSTWPYRPGHDPDERESNEPGWHIRGDD